MAINQPETQSVRGYWRKKRAQSITTIVMFELVLITLIFLVPFAAGVLDVSLITNVFFWTFAIIITGSSVALHAILIISLLNPLKHLSAAIVHISGEPSSIQAPNPNTQAFERNGLKPLLQTIYGEGTRSEASRTPNMPAPADISPLTTGLAYANVGLVAIGAEGQIVYANEAAPINTSSDGLQTFNILFDNDVPFDTWFADCEANAVHAEHTWERVANKPMGEQGRKLYDVTASYQKGVTVPAIVTFFEKTADYAPDDDDLNFVAFAAHELRGPITVIRGYLDTLDVELGPTLNDDQKQLFGRLVVSANRLTSYVNNILNTARYDRRHLKVHLQEVRLYDIYEIIADDMELRASSQRRLLNVNIPIDLPTIAADPASLDEVLSNLIDNAIKYSSEGSSIEVSARGDGESVEVSVIDHGIGMPSNVVSNLFHKFYRSHRSRETVPGTGIGLYISKAIVESHGGTMGVRSVEGEGSTFTFTVPTYGAVADKLQAAQGENVGIIKHGNKGWIKNHGTIRG